MRLASAGIVSLLLLAVMTTSCSDSVDPTQPDASSLHDSRFQPVPDGYGPLWKCENPGKACNAHDPCAVDPVCGSDKLCHPAWLLVCDDKLDCTKDVCTGLGKCDYQPLDNFCALPVQSAVDGGAGKVETRCFAKGAKRPDNPCEVCDPDTDGTTWTGASSGVCDDNDGCTKDDYCQAGVCKGTDFSILCSDNLPCTEDLCDGKGGCLGHQLKSSWCFINGKCYKDRQNNPLGTCLTCDASKNQKAWTTITASCQLDGKCYKAGDKIPQQCAECDPAISHTSWVVKGNNCLISGVCRNPGNTDPSNCKSCNPTVNKYDWSPRTDVCTIGATCQNKGVLHPKLCAECDPATSKTSWTVKGSACLINGVCLKSGDKDNINCAACDPAKDKYGWTALAGRCSIDGTCYNKGDKHPGVCAECDPAASASAWTVKTSTDCLIHNTCKKSGDKDLGGCASCQPTKNKHDWSPLPGQCKIDGACYATGATHPQSCGSCDPTKSASSWTPAGAGCMIDYVCYAAGATHPGGCGSCDSTKSKTAWTLTTGGCVIGGGCVGQGKTEPGGCGRCDPTISASSWTRGSACPVACQWSKAFGSSSGDYPAGVAVDANGNAYVTGYFFKSISVGGKTLTSAGNADVFLVSYSPSGSHRWSKRLGSTSVDRGRGIAVDAAGNIYVTGYFYGSINLGGVALTSNGSYDIFLASFTSAGAHRWSKSFGSTKVDESYDVAVDASGNVYLTGTFEAGLTFGGATLGNKGKDDIFLASFTSTGAHRWSKGFGSSADEYGYGVATDSGGNVYLTGYHESQGGLSFGGAALANNGGSDIYLASFTSAGAHRWSKGFGSTSSDYGYGVATGAGGSVYLTGYFNKTANFGGGKLTSKGGTDVFLASFTSAGAHRWSKNYGGPNNDYGRGVAADGGGNVYLTGYHATGIDFGGGTLAGYGAFDLFMVGINSAGKHRWSRSHGSINNDQGRRVACDGGGNAYFTGIFAATATFGGESHTSKGIFDVYLVKVGP